MVLDALVPANTANAKQTSENAFERYLEHENHSLASVGTLIEGNTTGKVLLSVMEGVALHLVFASGARGKPLAKNTIMNYFGRVKAWLLNTYPAKTALCESALHEMSRTLSTHCTNRDQGKGAIEKRAPPCTKNDLEVMIRQTYKLASFSADYADASLMSVMWYIFGRGSDVLSLRKSEMTIMPGGVLFMRFSRRKTSTAQGLSLFKAKVGFLSCPIHALAVGLIMETTPDEMLFTQISRVQREAIPASDVSLDDLIRGAQAVGIDLAGKRQEKHVGVRAVPGISRYVNKLVQRVSIHAVSAGEKLTQAMSSHSFRRGGAQYANADVNVSTQWIIDRGGWNVSHTNKAYLYICNTTKEDQSVAKSLSG